MMKNISRENDEILVEKYFSPRGTPVVPRPFWGLGGLLTTFDEILFIILTRSNHHFSTENDENLSKIIFHWTTPEFIRGRSGTCLGPPGHLYDCMSHYVDTQYFESII